MTQTATNTEMKTFPTPLLRLILCGGGGLPPAWGPLHEVGKVAPWAFNPVSNRVVDATHWLVMSAPLRWSLPLDSSSPWPARLALVAAWMLDRPTVGAWVGGNDHFLALTVLLPKGALLQSCWRTATGTRLAGTASTPDLPTLPAHLATLPPVAALPLALYDLPDVAARVAIGAG